MKNSFAEILSELRRERGISQKKAAKDLEISQALLSHYENGVREPKFEFVNRACVYYGVSADYILGRQETDAISIICQSPYTMDMTNTMEELIEIADTLDERTQNVIAQYFKSIVYGVKYAIEEPNHPSKPEIAGKQQMLLAQVYTALREIKE